MFDFVKTCFSWIANKTREMAVAPPPIVKRAEWGATPTDVTKKYAVADLPIYLIYCSFKSNLDSCKTKEECCNVLREAQAKSKKENLGDIPYSFIIAEDGTIYEGRGWEYKPQKAIEMEPKDFDPRAYDIGYFGDLSSIERAIPEAVFNATMTLVDYGVKRKYIFEQFDLEPFRKDKFEPQFYPGKEYFASHLKPIKITTPIEVKEVSGPKDEDDDEKKDKDKDSNQTDSSFGFGQSPFGESFGENPFANAKVKWDI